MKIAVLIFGHLRTFEFCAPLLKKNLLDLYDSDVFIHTWDEIDSSTVAWDKKEHFPGDVSEYIFNRVNTLYDPKDILIEKQIVKEDVIINSISGEKSASVVGMRYMFESMNKVNNLFKAYKNKTLTNYDAVLMTRPDIAIFSPLPIAKVFYEAEILNFDINKVRFFCGLKNDGLANVHILCNRACDMLFFGKEKVIDTFIGSNLDFTDIFVQEHFLNVVSIYVANEIKAGNIPQQICFTFGKDWKNVKFNDPLLHKGEENNKHSRLYKLFHIRYWYKKLEKIIKWKI